MSSVRGIFFTIAMFSLLSVLIFAIMAQRETVERSHQSFLLVEKATYAWHDISEDIRDVTDLNVTQLDKILNINDVLPAEKDIAAVASGYASFIRANYTSPDLKVSFQTSEGEEITDFSCLGKKKCSDKNIQFSVLPFNITYGYPDWNKKLLEINCGQNGLPCSFAYVQWFNITINLTNSSFTCNPQAYNNCTSGDIEWSEFDKVFSCSGSNQECVNYSLRVIDASGRVYACPGVYGDDNGNTKKVNCNSAVLNWIDDKTANLVFKIPSCQLKLSFGKKGLFKIKGDKDDNDCDPYVNTSVTFTFNTTNFTTNFASILVVTDTLLNNSKTSVLR